MQLIKLIDLLPMMGDLRRKAVPAYTENRRSRECAGDSERQRSEARTDDKGAASRAVTIVNPPPDRRAASKPPEQMSKPPKSA